MITVIIANLIIFGLWALASLLVEDKLSSAILHRGRFSWPELMIICNMINE